jgi:glutamate--cysteine ligase
MRGVRDLRADLERHAFRLGLPPAPLRLGVEVEALPVCAATGAAVPIRGPGLSTLPLIRGQAVERGWTETSSAHGAPAWRVERVGTVSYEPGGQIELAADPCGDAATLLAGVRGVMLPLARRLEDGGITLLYRGVAPPGAAPPLPLQLGGSRYRRMDAFLAAIGTGGERMMRRTAALQVSLDWGADPLLAWRVLNAMAPWVTAIFANSPGADAPHGHRSRRAAIWRELDGGRTGIFACERPVDEYLRFALDAPVILGVAAGWPPFERLLSAGGITRAGWREHLSTLFPEVRPRGFAEVRSADALPPDACAAPLVLLGGIVYHEPTLRAAAELLGRPDEGLLERAGREGPAAGGIAPTAAALVDLALRGAAALPAMFPAGVREAAAGFFERYTLRGRCPADDVPVAVCPGPVGAAAGA